MKVRDNFFLACGIRLAMYLAVDASGARLRCDSTAMLVQAQQHGGAFDARAMWYHRVLPVIRILLSGLAVSLAFSASEALVSPLSFGRVARAVTSALFASTVTIAVYCMCQRYIEKRVASEFSLQGAIKELAMGAALGALLLASTIAILALVHLTNPHATFLGVLAISIEAGTLLAAAFILTRRLWFFP